MNKTSDSEMPSSSFKILKLSDIFIYDRKYSDSVYSAAAVFPIRVVVLIFGILPLIRIIANATSRHTFLNILNVIRPIDVPVI